MVLMVFITVNNIVIVCIIILYYTIVIEVLFSVKINLYRYLYTLKFIVANYVSTFIHEDKGEIRLMYFRQN